MIYREDKGKVKTVNKLDNRKGSEKGNKEDPREVLQQISEPKTPITLPDHIYSELDNFASKNYDFFKAPSASKIPDFSKKKGSPIQKPIKLNEEKVVEMVKKWRLDENTSDDHSEKEKQSKTLKKDNIALKEVVEIIKNH